MAFASNKPLYLLRMDLCGPMRFESINGKRYVLVIVDDYSRCYLLNDYDDVGKLKANRDIRVFIGYSKESVAFIISISILILESFQEESTLSSLNNDVQQSSEEVKLPLSNTQSVSNNMVPNVNEASAIELANVAEALKDVDWVSAMQEELDQFARLKV
ncbi:retrovirus-related pol polyprotein from transposon TNT 1-94 [Tanacetum coccineum]